MESIHGNIYGRGLTSAIIAELSENGWRAHDRNGRLYPLGYWIRWKIGYLSYGETVSCLASDMREGGETGRLIVSISSNGFAVVALERIEHVLGETTE